MAEESVRTLLDQLARLSAMLPAAFEVAALEVGRRQPVDLGVVATAVQKDATGPVELAEGRWPIVVGDELYVLSDPGILTCVDAKSGTVLWQQRLGGDYSASPVAADGRIYFLAEQGVTTVIAAGKEFRRLAVNQLDGSTLASMAVANGAFFVRSDHHLYRIGGS